MRVGVLLALFSAFLLLQSIAQTTVTNEKLELSLECPKDFKLTSDPATEKIVVESVPQNTSVFSVALLPVAADRLPKEAPEEFFAKQVIEAAKKEFPKIEHTEITKEKIDGATAAHFEMTHPGAKRARIWIVIHGKKVFMIMGVTAAEQIAVFRPIAAGIVQSIKWASIAQTTVKNKPLEMSLECPEGFKLTSDPASEKIVIESVSGHRSDFSVTLVPLSANLLPKESPEEYMAEQVIAEAKKLDPAMEHTEITKEKIDGASATHFEITHPGAKRACIWIVIHHQKIFLLMGATSIEQFAAFRPIAVGIVQSIKWAQ